MRDNAPALRNSAGAVAFYDAFDADAKRHSAGRLVAGGVADIVMFDPAARWQVQPSALVSQGKHTPFAFESTGFELAGRVRLTLVAGQVAHDAQDRADA